LSVLIIKLQLCRIVYNYAPNNAFQRKLCC